MSYILDALRRADAERERDPGRGIHAHPVPLPAESARRTPLWIAAGGAALVLLVAFVMLLRPSPRVSQHLNMPPPNAPMSRQQPPRSPVVTIAAEVSPPAPPAAPVVAPAAPAVAPAPAAPARPAAQPVAALAPATPVPAVAAEPAPMVVKAPPVAAAVPAAAPTPAPAAPLAGPAERVLAVAELPADVQRELPKLQISGGVHSDNAAQRMLIVGGHVVTEGAEAAPGVVLEQIRPKSAVLKFRGWRYSVQY
jgi:general secretion pathway protein B